MTQLPGDAEINSSIYKELRKLAAAKMRLERGCHTLQPTALVHEAYMRLAAQPESIWKDRSRILGLAAHAMRHILVDYARAHSAGKRGAGAVQVPRQAKVMELHFFAGLTFEEIAAELQLSVRTIKRASDMANAWLRSQLRS